jgi:hypothetical protein
MIQNALAFCLSMYNKGLLSEIAIEFGDKFKVLQTLERQDDKKIEALFLSELRKYGGQQLNLT